ncbi:thioesterase domain-containing protein [Kutzneria buriramensis]|uniref:thioesterase domain-containing protein n=1 Tax=Kutzneria buriramensis TaxID=1045776 RepID=UPI0011C16C43|nr:thioesterase domain-containing protein [Kutzneria buriramensis]
MTVHVSGGVRIERLRDGSNGTLVLVPGLDGDPDELAGVVAAYAGTETLYWAAPMLLDGDGEPVETVERMAELLVAALDEVVADEDYHLAGYSFGGLLAWEMARQRTTPGHVFLVEAIFDERFWDRRVWLGALRHRMANQLTRIAKLPPRQAIAEFSRRAERLLKRFARRKASGEAQAVSSGDTDAGRRAYRAIAQYKPQYYEGAVTVVAATDTKHFGCDTAQIWRGLARQETVRRVVGDHLTIVSDPNAAAAVADGIARDLSTRRGLRGGLRPEPGYERVLIVSTMRWFSAARLSDAMVEAGFSVSVCRLSGHPLELVDGLAGDYPLHKSRPLRSIEAAIRASKPDLVMCDDERSLVLLQRLHSRLNGRDPELGEILTRSLGRVEDWPTMASRTGIAMMADAAGVSAPATQVVKDLNAVREWVDKHGLPAMLKTDGSSGGRGVAPVGERSALEPIWRALSSPPTPLVAVKRALVNRELQSFAAFALRRRPTVNVQEFRLGRDAITTVFCHKGEVLASTCLEIVLASEARGPSAVVRVVDHPGMADAARQIVRRFGLSGFYGLDFVLDEADTAWLVELNARITPTCHLLLDAPRPVGQVIALFPFERPKDPGLAAYSECVDVPVRAPLLVERGQQLAARQHHPVRRRVREWTSRTRAELPL